MQTIALKTPNGSKSVEATAETMLLMREAVSLGRLFHEAGYELALVGGAVRDLLRGSTPVDLDMASDAEPRESEAILREWGESCWDVGRKHGTVDASRTLAEGVVASIEVTTYQGGGHDPSSREPTAKHAGRLEEDLSLRDFTADAVAIRLPGLEVVDPFDGVKAIEDKTLTTPLGAAVSFGADPLRMMRACRLAASLGFRVDEETIAGMRRMAGKIRESSVEGVRDELCKTLLSDAPSVGLRLMLETGLMGYVLPEVEALHKMDGSSRGLHKLTFEHTMMVLDRAVRFEKTYPDIGTPDLTLRLAALMHDVGKPATRRFHAGKQATAESSSIGEAWDGRFYTRKRVTFDGHESVGAALTRNRLEALRFDKKTIGDVSTLVAMHMRLHGYVTDPSSASSASMWTDSAVRRYVREAGPLYSRLNALTRADVTTRRKAREQEHMRRVDAIEDRVAALEKQEDLDSIHPELDGVEIMRLLGLQQGPLVGKAVKHMLEYRLEHGEVGHEAAVVELRKWAAANLPASR